MGKAKDKKPARRLYFAYGANTNLRGMLRRCPEARPVAPCKLRDWTLRFRLHADVEAHKGSVVHGALWSITPDDEAALDLFEGYPRYYVKVLVDVRRGDKVQPVMLYVMRERTWCEPPTMEYEQALREGYEQFGLPQAQLDRALDRAERESVARRPMLDLYGEGRYYVEPDEYPAYDEPVREPVQRKLLLTTTPAKPTRLHEVAEECQSSYDNMPEGLQQGDTGQLLEERVQAMESAADELEGMDFSDAPEDAEPLPAPWVVGEVTRPDAGGTLYAPVRVVDGKQVQHSMTPSHDRAAMEEEVYELNGAEDDEAAEANVDTADYWQDKLDEVQGVTIDTP